MKKLEKYILSDAKNSKSGKGIEIMDKADLMTLNQGAEITDTEEDEDDEEYE